MKHLFWMLLIGVFVNQMAPSRGLAQDANLMAHWPLDGTANDVSGNDRHAVLMNGAAFGPDRFGTPDSALVLDGFDDFVNIGNGVKPPFPFTVNVWIQPGTTPQDFGAGIFRNDDVDSQGYRSGAMISLDRELRIQSAIYNGFASSRTRRSLSSEAPVASVGAWGMVTAVFRAHDDMELYWNGTRIEDAVWDNGTASSMRYSSAAGALGHGDSRWASPFFAGSIDDVQVFSHALPEEEIAVLFTGPEPGISFVHPRTIGDTGSVTLTIYGSAFTGTSSVALVSTETSIEAAHIEVASSGRRLTARFELRRASPGAWAVETVKARPVGAIVATLENAVTVEAAREGPIWADVLGPSAIRVDRPAHHTLAIGNAGNVDIERSEVLLSIPEGLTLNLDIPLDPPSDDEVRALSGDVMVTVPKLGPGEVLTASGLLVAAATGTYLTRIGASISWQPTDQTVSSLELRRKYFDNALISEDNQEDEFSSKPRWESCESATDEFPTFSNGSYWVKTRNAPPKGFLVFYRSEANFNAFLSVAISLGNGTVAHMIGGGLIEHDWQDVPGVTVIETVIIRPVGWTPALGERWFQGYDANRTSACQGVIPDTFCWMGMPTKYLSPGKLALCPAGFYCASCTHFVRDAYVVDGMMRLDIENMPRPWRGCLKNIPPHMDKRVSALLDQLLVEWHREKCPVENWEWLYDVTTQSAFSWENNPACYDREKQTRAVRAVDPNEKYGPDGFGDARFLNPTEPLKYVISFENLESASAAAQVVTIEDELDPDVFDLNTLVLGPVGFGEQTPLVPSPRPVAFEDTARVADALGVDVNVKATMDEEGHLRWTFTSVDPSTGAFPEDPLAGFLPPNVNSPEGEGYVTFFVNIKSDLPHETVIANQASIVFDENAAILTQTWSNTLDKAAPQSRVHVVEVGDGMAMLDWTGTDEGAGIRDYTVYVRDTDDVWSVFRENTPETGADFEGEVGAIYAFRVVARDLVGNVEPDDKEPELEVQLSSPDITLNGCGCRGVPAKGGWWMGVAVLAAVAWLRRRRFQSPRGAREGHSDEL